MRGDGGVAEAPGEPKPDDPDATTPAEERSLIYTGTITVKVTQVAQAADQAIAIATGLGGVVGGDNRTIDEDRSQAILVLRVPAERFSSTLDAMAKLGTEESRQVQATDVTDSMVDLDARVATQEASVNRVRDLLARAQTIGEIVALESELTRRQADLDSLKQRRAKLSGLVALATITVVLRGPAAKVEGPTEPETGFLAGLKAGWKGFLASVKIVLTGCRVAASVGHCDLGATVDRAHGQPATPRPEEPAAATVITSRSRLTTADNPAGSARVARRAGLWHRLKLTPGRTPSIRIPIGGRPCLPRCRRSWRQSLWRLLERWPLLKQTDKVIHGLAKLRCDLVTGVRPNRRWNPIARHWPEPVRIRESPVPDAD